MKINVKLFLIFLIIICSGFFGLKKSTFKKPQHFPIPNFNFKKEPLTHSKITLGRALFYDPILSKDNSISCATCHSPYNAFAHSDHALSHGINDQIGIRNAPALFNLAWQKTFMWDGAINHLDMQALAPISDSKEMNETIENVVKKLNAKKLYGKLFFRAFGDSMATGATILKALSQFQLSLISADSKYDRVKLKKAKFTSQEESGYNLFVKNCNSCHTEPLFTNLEFANNGMPIDPLINDLGKYRISKITKDSLLFKVPSLRNLRYSEPFGHDGRFKKIRDVLNHYTDGIQMSKTVANELLKPMRLTSNEKTDLIAFLNTLNDSSFVFNPKNKFPNILLSTEGKKRFHRLNE